ncbi:patatin-like protein [Stappia sp.]|uniref:patatin-like protein n=1 Tax=Stappia sp. TaxID=1870903 RepID=UPI003A99A227
MKQIELRLALVLYGGVSLAVYMHGITREFLSLVRASRRLEAHRGNGKDRQPGGRRRATRIDPLAHADPLAAGHGGAVGEGGNAGAADLAASVPGEAPQADEPSVAAYAELLALFRPKADLRVVVDVISGASAGGVNGIMLGRALAHNLSLEQHRDLWLENADVTRLAGDPVGLTRYLKGSIAPVLDRLVSRALKSEVTDAETRAKLRQFMQARWFTPPFSGERYVGWMLDAAQSMARPSGLHEPETLIPRGQSLDLFVTTTDYHGARRRFPIDDGVEVEETEHRRILHYGARCRGTGEIESAFTDASVPDLVFSARATSSFPGAFPPMTVGEMDKVLAERGETWPNREAFLAAAFPEGDAEARILIDGSVVMNKPFQPVLEAISGRPASREVVRRIVYVDPLAGNDSHAEEGDGPLSEGPRSPGFFRVILASLAHIPRNEPIGDALEQVADYNREVAQVAEVIAAAEPVVEQEVRSILRGDGERPMTVKELSRSRAMVNERAHVFAGYAYHGYQRLKLAGIATRTATLLAGLVVPGTGRSVEQRRSEAERRIARLLEAWIARQRVDAGISAGAMIGEAGSGTPEPILRLLRALDVDYRVRRLRFVIRRLNLLYRETDPEAQVDPVEMDELKSTLYEQVEHLTQRWSVDFYGEATRNCALRLLSAPIADTDTRVEELIALLGARMGLADLDKLSDDIFSVMALNYLPPRLRRSLNTAYLGFAFYDLVTLPVLRRSATAEHNEIRVDRISPTDANSLRPGGVTLKGRSLNAFGAFFNRRWREHDYLWGRLTAADRLIAIAVRAASAEVSVSPAQLRVARRNVFRAILEEERGKLDADPTLVPMLLEDVEAMFADGSDEEVAPGTGVPGEAAAAFTPRAAPPAPVASAPMRPARPSSGTG